MGKTRKSWHGPDWYGSDREMSAEEHVYHAERCAGKLAYQTRAKAVRAKRSKARRFGKRYGVYRCPYCNKYHLTTRRERNRTDVQNTR